MKVHYIKAFVFNVAEYRISDGQHEIMLTVDYSHNTFTITGDVAKIDTQLKTEIAAIAHDLLKRKHGVNFAGR